MRTGPASSAFANIVAVTTINGRRNEQARPAVPSHPGDPTIAADQPRQSPAATAAPLHAGGRVAPGQLLFAQLVAQEWQAATLPHRQAVAAYPSLAPAHQIMSRPRTLVRLAAPIADQTLLDFEV